ncbi:hypothetical protein Y032_0127g1389 [Ancylostoma ceylanicum]|uniref:Cysteine-rich DPF motif domain-containing protein 1 n=2 Tax=Ancylostoma ceylanicum TaxID=53326 RepID=A0A016T834_9BILA|nr:hypothetical protein Y032_0127g1389 [Ancylostoma ceylanicum]
MAVDGTRGHAFSTNTVAGPSGHVKETNQETNRDDDVSNLEPFVQFHCAVCKLDEKCFFGDLKASDGFYPAPVFYMRDPFVPPRRVKGRKPVLSDFLVLGSSCSLCNQSVCLDKTCSVYFGALFCTTCITRERRRFPEMLPQMVAKAQSATNKPSK